jgi:serine/threonine-protein kinase HipA
MPEVEDLTMHLAEICGIETVKHGLIRMDDGELAYITRRVDRKKNGAKLSMLDMCQLTNRLTEHKYRGAYIQLAEVIKKYSVSSMLDVQRFWEIVLFSWITGNSDMHCKNFSLLEYEGIGYQLSPAYDLLSVKLVHPADRDELAMPLIGAGVFDTPIVNFNRDSFVEAMSMSGISEPIINKIISKMISYKDKWFDMIEKSFLNSEFKEQYKSLLTRQISKLK